MATRIFGQDFKVWHAEKNNKAVRFTAKFIGLTREKAVFENDSQKRAEIDLASLSHDSLIQLVKQLASAAPPKVTLPPSAQSSATSQALNKPAWQRRIAKSFARAVREMEKLRADFYKDSDDWVATKRKAKDSEFLQAYGLYEDEFSFDCEILEIIDEGFSRTATISNDKIGELKLKGFIPGTFGSRTIKSLNVDKGTKATLYGEVCMTTNSQYGTNEFKLVEYGIETNGRTYFLMINKLHIE